MRADVAAAGWRIALPALAASVAVLLVVYWGTAGSMAAIWMRSDTFAHGFLIVPISAALVWAKRRELARIAPAPDVLGLALLALAAAAWLAAKAAEVLVVQQYAATATIPAVVLAVAGRKAAHAIVFPLAFLFFAVPVGEGLIPPLMAWTADFTVTALQLSAIPVYREGLYFSIPSGNWSIVEGCSGIRYLIASVTVGALFAYLSYRRPWKRALFMLLAIAVPVVANGLRAYGIVMIAHLSDMKLALGVDHIIYGWLFFGLVMVVLFWIGSWFRDPKRPLDARSEVALAEPNPGRGSAFALAASAAAAAGLAAAGPLYGAYLDRGGAMASQPVLASPEGLKGWSRAGPPLTQWRPQYRGPQASIFDTYRKGDRAVAVYLGYYRNQRQGAELVNSQNVMVVQKHPVWSSVGEAASVEALPGGAVELRETRLRSPEQRLLVWDWLWISGASLSSPYLAKLYLARDRLLGRGDDAAAIILAAPYEGQAESAQQTLREFVREMFPSIEAALAAAKRGG